MGLFADTVPREMYEDMREQRDQALVRYDKLFDEYSKLRPTHAPVKPMTLHMPKTDSGTEAVRAAEVALVTPRIRGVAENLMREKPLLSEADALREAMRLERIITGKELPIAAGELNMPPAR